MLLVVLLVDVVNLLVTSLGLILVPMVVLLMLMMLLMLSYVLLLLMTLLFMLLMLLMLVLFMVLVLVLVSGSSTSALFPATLVSHLDAGKIRRAAAPRPTTG